MAFNYPSDLVERQRELQQVRAELGALCASLPWSVEPMSGEGLQRQDSPGYSAEQKEALEALWRRLRELTEQVLTHPFFSGDEVSGRVVEARMALKHAAGAVDDVAAEPAPKEPAA